MGKIDEDFPIVTLKEGTEIWMSDTPFEQEGLHSAAEEAHGDVLTAGLGLGIFPVLVELKDEVTSITVIEASREVVGLVWKHIAKPKMRVLIGDIWRYLKATTDRYDHVFLDPWNDWVGPIQQADLALAAASNVLKPDGKARVWMQELCDRVKNALPKEPVEPGPFHFYRPPCLVCGKITRYDFAGLCLDCADMLGVSSLFLARKG